MPTQLATLEELKAWLKASGTNFTDADNALLNALLMRASNLIFEYISNSDVVKRAVEEVRDGTNSIGLMLREWPVLSISSLSINGVAINAATGATDTGYILAAWRGTGAGQPQMLKLRNKTFYEGIANVSVSYVAGYVISGEQQTINSSHQVTASANAGDWAASESVKFADTGEALTKVASAPAPSQYSVAAGVYTFNTVDDGRSVLLEYSYIPATLTQACVEWVSERYNYRTRIGQTSKSVGGQETVSFSIKDIPDFIALALQPFCKVTPC